MISRPYAQTRRQRQLDATSKYSLKKKRSSVVQLGVFGNVRKASRALVARGVAASLALGLGPGGPSTARAGAWTLPEGQGQIIQTFLGWLGWGSASSHSREDKIETQTYVQYGVSDRLTAIGVLSLERYALSAPKDVYTGLGTTGAGLRARVWSNDAWTFALEATAFYGGASDASRPAQAGGAGLGADARALAAYNLHLWGKPAFIDVEAGYRLRTLGPPSEWKGDLTLGVDWTPRAQILLQTFNTISQGAGRDGFPAWEAHKGVVSLVYALDEKWSVQIGGFSTIWRRNAASEYGAVIAVWRRF
jgi:hypothetical protein